MKSRFLLAGLAALALGCVLCACRPGAAADVEANTCAGKSGCIVPFEIIDNRIFVPVCLNGQGPFHFILDTGAGATVSTEVAEKLQLPHEGETDVGGVGNSRVHGYRSRVKSAAIGTAPAAATAGPSVENIDVEVLPFTDSSAVFGKIPVDGYIGFPFYEKYVVEHDYLGKTLTFRDPKTFTYGGQGTVLEIESTDYVPVVRGTLDGGEAKFGIDTGARSALLLYGPFVASRGLRERYNPKFRGVTGWGIGGPVRSEIARIASVGLGGIEIRDVVARFSLNTSGATAGNSKAGLIGPDILKQFTVICDYSRKRLILEKNKNFGVRDTYDKAGVWLIQSGDMFEVLDVIAGGSAEKAGLHVGDKVITVNGESTRDISLPELRDHWKYAAAGTKVRVQVQNASGTKELVFDLQEII